MLAFVTGLIIAFAEGGHGAGGGGGWYSNVEPYLNYPGFELWRFLNLGIFVLIAVYLLRKPLSDVFKAKREAIRADLIRAEKEKADATAKLEAAEAKVSGVPEEKVDIIENARAEAEAESKRLAAETESEIKRAREQALTEISRKTAQVNVQLRRFSAEESIRLAEEKVRSSINSAKDAELVQANIDSIGGMS
jgi:F0F1-type ATP synthase membrane subunit b/b'